MADNNNPYESPQSTFDDQPSDPVELIQAGHGRRFLNLIIDYAAFFVLSAVIGLVFALIWGEEGIDAIDGVPDMLFGFVVMFIYYVPSEYWTQRTLGKLLTGTKVVNVEGRQPSFGQVVGRLFCRFIPFEPFSFFGGEARGWHDSIPKTYVVKCR